MNTTNDAPTNTVLQDVLHVLRQHGKELRAQGVQHLFVFGSMARDEHGPQSDIDLAVELQAPDMGLMRFTALQRRLEKLLRRKVDLISLSPHTSPQLVDSLRREAVRAF